MAFAFGDDEPDWAVDPFGDPGEGGDDDGGAPLRGGGALYGAEHLLFLLDCDASMFEAYVPCRPDDFDGASDGEAGEGRRRVSPMDVAVTAAHRFLRTKIRYVAETRGGKRDAVGVMLYGCDPRRAPRRSPPESGDGRAPVFEVDDDDDDGPGGEELPTTHELVELHPPGIEQVLALQACQPGGDPNRGRRDLRGEFAVVEGDAGGEDEEEGDEMVGCSLLQGLMAAQKVFGESKLVKAATPSGKQLPDSKTVWIFTNQDDPCRGNEGLKARMDAIQKDFRDADIAINVLPLPKKNAREFDRSVFYGDMVAPPISPAEDEDDAGEAEAGAVDVEALLENFAVGTRKRRKYATLPLLLPGWRGRGDDPGIMLDLYGVVQVRNKPQKISVHQENNKATNKKTRRINVETGETVEDEDVHEFADFCGRVPVRPATLAKMKKASNSQDAAGLVVHGFRPRKFLPTTRLLSRNSLALANDALVRGSEKALYNLKQSMQKKDVFAVGELLARATATSRMVALVPKDGGCGGFVVAPLPYREDTREVPPGDIGHADRGAVDAAKGLIARATLDFPGDFEACLPENPWLKHFFGYLESVSLGRPLGAVEDDARMDAERMLETAREEIEAFSLSLPEDDVPAKRERKRKEPPASSKPEFVREGIDEEWIDMYKNDELDALKNDQLKAFLKGQGERVAGRKSDLVDRVIRVIEKELFKES